MDDELKYIDSLNDFELAQYFQDHLILRSTGGSLKEDAFIKSRNLLISNKAISHLLPK